MKRHQTMLDELVVSDLPVMMSTHCKTCPFRPNKAGRYQDQEMADAVTARTLFKAQQICHGTKGKNRKPNHRCKGSYDNNKTIYDRMGLGSYLK